MSGIIHVVILAKIIGAKGGILQRLFRLGVLFTGGKVVG